MDLSGRLIKAIMVSLDAFTQATGMNIRLHGTDAVPGQPVLFVVNHFTRLETVLMPYIIMKTFNRYPLSLAAASFFGGTLGDMMQRLGAISTADPKRDTRLINALLTDSNPVIIFPEGQMIKDKKLIERGRYSVFNPGGRRPPHTGAGRIALRSQFIREELRLFRERGDEASVLELAEYFGFDPDDVEWILGKETVIVPVNITYYPVRAAENIISRVAGRLVEDLPARALEEMLVEGSMITGGVDMDINFGAAIAMKPYIAESAGLHRMLSDEKLYLHPEELKHAAPFMKHYIRIMYRYMDAIYAMTTVNHDHLFSCILTQYRSDRIREDDFKNRVFLAIENLRRSGLTNYHTSLDKKQFYLLTDDAHDKYDSFIESSRAEGLIILEGGYIVRNRERFSEAHEFHAIRKDNIIEVLRNEIEPLRELTRSLNRLMLLPDFWVRKKIRDHFVDLDQKLFDDDYRQYCMEGENKPKNIGAPFFLKRLFGRKGVILVHGYLAAPEEIRPLADYLYRHGYSVYGARLRGHGTVPEDLAIRDWKKWYDSVGRAYIIMKNSTRSLAVAGFSTGGDLALLQAANKPGRFKAVISINAPLSLQHISSKFASVVVAWNTMLSTLHLEKGKVEFVSNEPQNRHINYFRNPVSGVRQLEKLMQTVEKRLKDINDPVLVIQGTEDPVVNPESGRTIFEKLGSESKSLVSIRTDQHGILWNEQVEEVRRKVLAFLDSLY
ncbi:MAG: alpha/beta hydrolase [Syntrophales bacterium]|jgi:esterase/lipase/1-acyl-sn-glycerol-3-phosphate acyltransferase|nr:alpha/beta hydrolase [Syntrophales bacterium]MDX9923104.1 alpha/beta hydrolase [Syntrophales bacterium]